MKRDFYLIFLCILYLPGVLYLAILFYGTFHHYGRTFEATIDRVGWQMVFTEQNADTVLNMCSSKM